MKGEGRERGKDGSGDFTNFTNLSHEELGHGPSPAQKTIDENGVCMYPFSVLDA